MTTAGAAPEISNQAGSGTAGARTSRARSTEFDAALTAAAGALAALARQDVPGAGANAARHRADGQARANEAAAPVREDRAHPPGPSRADAAETSPDDRGNGERSERAAATRVTAADPVKGDAGMASHRPAPAAGIKTSPAPAAPEGSECGPPPSNAGNAGNGPARAPIAALPVGGASAGVRAGAGAPSGPVVSPATPGIGRGLPGSRAVPTVARAAPKTPPTGASRPDPVAVEAQALRGILASARKNGGVITLRLQPDQLGELRIRIEVHGREVTALIDAGTDPARELLSESRDSLRAALEARGLAVERLEVRHDATLAPRDHDRPAEDSPGHNHGDAGDRQPRDSRSDSARPGIGAGDEGGREDAPGETAEPVIAAYSGADTGAFLVLDAIA